MSWFAIALAEIRTRRILREKADYKQSNVKRLEPAHLFTGPVDNKKLDTPKQLEVKGEHDPCYQDGNFYRDTCLWNWYIVVCCRYMTLLVLYHL